MARLVPMLIVLVSLVAAVRVRAEPTAKQIPALMKLPANPDVRQGASVALVGLGRDAVAPLRKALVAGEADVRVWSAYTLGRLGAVAEAATGDLGTALSSPDAALRAAAAEALGRLGPDAADAAGELAPCLADEEVQVRRQAAVALGRIRPHSETAIAGLIESLSDITVRSAARDALIQIGEPAVEPLVKSLDVAELRFDLALVLAAIDPERAQALHLNRSTAADLPGLTLVLRDPSRKPAERIAASEALVSLGTPGVDVVIQSFELATVASEAAGGFSHDDQHAVAALSNALAHENSAVRAAAADALGLIGPGARKAVGQLAKLLKDENREVRYRTVRSLHEMGQASAPAAASLIEVMLDPKESEPTRQWALKALVVTLPDTRDAVVDALARAGKDKSNYGVSSLARRQLQKIEEETAGKAAKP